MRKPITCSILLVLGSLQVACAGSEPAATDPPVPTVQPTDAPAPTATASFTPAPTARPTATPTPDLTGTTGLTLTTLETDLGTILAVAESQRAVYIYQPDPPGRSTCTGSCRNLWPVVDTEGFPQAEGEVDPALLGYLTDRDGSFVVTYNDHPLYLYGGDLEPGSTLGQGVGGVWFVMRPSGEPRR